eukprot:7704066-Heterocapsa_arctica.AAC.1
MGRFAEVEVTSQIYHCGSAQRSLTEDQGTSQLTCLLLTFCLVADQRGATNCARVHAPGRPAATGWGRAAVRTQ